MNSFRALQTKVRFLHRFCCVVGALAGICCGAIGGENADAAAQKAIFEEAERNAENVSSPSISLILLGAPIGGVIGAYSGAGISVALTRKKQATIDANAAEWEAIMQGV